MTVPSQNGAKTALLASDQSPALKFSFMVWKIGLWAGNHERFR